MDDINKIMNIKINKLKPVKIYIYQHIITINGNTYRYIGQTKSTKHRWSGANYKNCKLFKNAIDTYGFGNFKHEVLLVVDNEIEANYFERYYILKYNTINPQYGFNEDIGGNLYREGFKFTKIFKHSICNPEKDVNRTKFYHDYYNKILQYKYKDVLQNDKEIKMY